MADEEVKVKTKVRATKFRVTRAVAADDNVGRGRVEKDSFEDLYSSYDVIVAPPYSFSSLYTNYQDSDVLQSCVKAMQKNVDGFGYDLVFTKNDLTQRDTPEAIRQHTLLKNFFDYTNDEEAFQTVRHTIREDFEVLGNAAIECVRRPRTNQLAMMYSMPITDVRMCRLDDAPVNVKVTVLRDGALVSFFVKKRYRKFVQVNAGGDKKLKWFKSFGDTRPMDATTGEYKKSASQCVEIATEILWLKNSFGGRTYGVPRWIGCVTDVVGRSLAQFVNYDLFTNQGIPPMMIIVENGSLTDESKQELQDLLESMRGAANFNRVGLLEAVPEISGLDNDTTVKVTIKNMTDYRNDDQMFKSYLQYTYDVIRQAFRLPALYLGGVGVYSYSTAMTASQVAEQQIFQVERRLFDEIINRKILWNEFGCDMWQFKSRGPQTVGSNDIINAVNAFSTAGALTTNNVIEISNKFLGTEISQYPGAWANYPHSIVMELLKQGIVSLPDLITPQPAVTTPTEQLVSIPAAAGITLETTELPTAQQGEPPEYS